MGIFKKLFASENDRNIKKLKVIADKVMLLEDEMSSLSDSDLRKKTDEFKERLKKGETLHDLLPEAFAVVREASVRTLNMKHYYVQVLGGIALFQGRIAEMRTGEGKTLVESLPAYLSALNGKGVHIVTVNEYLAKRDSQWIGKIFKFLGLTVGITTREMSAAEKKENYARDIIYGTNSEYGFDYLRDNSVRRKSQKMQRGLHFAIVDEVDSVLIDEARSPLILTGGAEIKTDNTAGKVKRFAITLKRDIDVDIEEDKNNIRLTEKGISKAETFFGVNNLSDVEHIELNHYIKNAIRAKFMMKKDKDYIVQNDEIMLVDQFTGRVMNGRRFSDGLHQAIEAKEGLTVKNDKKVMATITYQNYFRLYEKLSGMTGTAKTEEIEFNKIYNLDVVTIPTNKDIKRKDYPDIIFASKEGKENAIIRLVKEKVATGQPVLVGVANVDKSEELSSKMKKAGIKHNTLNAKNHEKESEIIAQAGRKGAITIATNMAGRGTDILLGGNPEHMAIEKLRKEKTTEALINEATSYSHTEDAEIIEVREKFRKYLAEFKEKTDKEKLEVIELGGLCVIGSERHDNRRIDNQLRGRSGRQGDEGESVFYISLDDNLARVFGGERIKGIATRFNIDENEPLFQMKFISNQIEKAQKKVEGMHFGGRKNILQFDDVVNAQRTLIYNERDKVLDGADIHDQVLDMIVELAYESLSGAANDEVDSSEWDLEKLNTAFEEYCVPKETNFFTKENVAGKDLTEVIQMATDELIERYENKAEEVNNIVMLNTIGEDATEEQKKIFRKNNKTFANIEREIMLIFVDREWIEHIDATTILKNEIFTRTDPLTAFKKESNQMFEEMNANIRRKVAQYLLNISIKISLKRKENAEKEKKDGKFNIPTIQKTVKYDIKEPNRNAACACGSGKKFKACCGKEGK